ncbi:IclR family transcriptional regulator [Enterovibrio paralichthyis]|uniref:IclR family transcriptional regulator n=1 Tax=Enterovibrio paralichthyis TaxID=2853805 RepID=UPI0006D04EB3|nr:IclR family transcriptional regulator [Enterovibrio paralichthyis]MBV7298036.1 IclR family transcriptional regulator [Enterovibrio paralichthyis]
MTTEKREKASSIARVLEIIEAISCAERPPSPAELSLMLDIPKPSIHRLLQQLERDGFVQTNMRGNLIPAKRLHDMALGVLHTTHFKALRQAILQKLADEIGETCGISLPNGIDMIYYDRIQTNWPLQINLPVGSNTPVWCTASGKLYLSTLTKRRRQRLINNLTLEQLARNTITDPILLERELTGIAERELGVDNEEFIDGMVAISVPIYNEQGQLHACLFTHAPVLRTSLDDLLQFEPHLRRAAMELESLMREG